MVIISRACRLQISKWTAFGILATVTLTNMISSTVEIIHAVSVFVTAFECEFIERHSTAVQMVLFTLFKINGNFSQRSFDAEADLADQYELKAKLIIASAVIQVLYHGAIVWINLLLFRYPSALTIRRWWWFTMAIVYVTLAQTTIDQWCAGNVFLSGFENTFTMMRRSYNDNWKIFVFDVLTLVFIKFYYDIMRYCKRLLHLQRAAATAAPYNNYNH